MWTKLEAFAAHFRRMFQSNLIKIGWCLTRVIKKQKCSKFFWDSRMDDTTKQSGLERENWFGSIL